MVRSYYPSECHADYLDFERIEALKPAIEACGISDLKSLDTLKVQILEAFLWFVLITLLNVTLIILTLSVSRLLNLLLRLVAFPILRASIRSKSKSWRLFYGSFLLPF